MFCIFLWYGDNVPPTLGVRLTMYSTLIASLLLFLVSFVSNILGALKRRWIGVIGVLINLLSAALIIGIGVLIATLK